MTDSDISRVYERLDNLCKEVAELRGELKTVNQRCVPCAKLVEAHQQAIHAKNGLIVEMTKLKTGRVDTLSVSSVCKIIASLGAALVGVIAAMATFAS